MWGAAGGREGGEGRGTGAGAVSWLLRLAVFGHALGLALTVFQLRQTQFGNLLFLGLFGELWEVDDPYLAAVFTERVTVSLFLFGAVISLFRPLVLVLGGLAVYAFAEAFAGMYGGGYHFSEWTIMAHALRWGTPLALVLLVVGRGRARVWVVASVVLMRALIAVVFVAHGWQALQADPRFIDLILGTAVKLIEVRPTEEAVVGALQAIAVVDFIVAIGVLFFPMRRRLGEDGVSGWGARVFGVVGCGLCLWLSAWGLVTAFSRMTSLGIPSGLAEYPEVLMRASHVLVPIALWLLVRVEKLKS
jgi:hypothetical protein